MSSSGGGVFPGLDPREQGGRRATPAPPPAPANPWVAAGARLCPPARVRLFCLPYAGGGASIYRTWGRALPAQIEVCPVQLPGRESRLREPLIRHAGQLLDALEAALTPWTSEPYALFGHSMGGFLAHELAGRFVAAGRNPPRVLFVSARPAPSLCREWLSGPVASLSDAELLRDLSRLHAANAAVLANEELSRLFLPILRADFEVCQSYRPAALPPLAVPVVALGGLADPSVDEEALRPWERTTSRSFSLRLLAGDHFFLNAAGGEVCRLVAQHLMPHV